MKILVQKFGGTSVGSIDRIKAVAEICASELASGYKLLVVVSAMGKSTDTLVSLMEGLTDTPNAREQDMLLSSGEQVSIALLSMALSKLGLKAISLTGWQAGIVTEAKHGRARICSIDEVYLRSLLEKGYVPVVAGFQGITEDGEITTLGRGGSDTTAVALAVALDAERCDIYTDVDGVHSTDPRLVSKTSKLETISYDEMLELASLGAQVLHPRSVELAKCYSMPMRVRSSWKREDKGTLVCDNAKPSMLEGARSVCGVALDRKQARLSIVGVPDKPGIAHSIFTELSDQGVSVDVIVQCVSQDGFTEVDFTVGRADALRAQELLKSIAVKIGARETAIDPCVVKVSAVGAGMIDQPGIASTMFKALGDRGINIQMISTSEIRISCIVSEEQGELAVGAIHDAFGLAPQG